MISLSGIALSLTAIVTAFFSPIAAWTIIGFGGGFLLLILIGAKSKKQQYQSGLSPKANDMINKFGHYYAMPFASSAFSAAASALVMAGWVIAIIGAFKGFWIGFVLMIVNQFLCGWLSRSFNPTKFLVDEDERLAHLEVTEWMQNQ
jgi:hypothetical protein